MGTVYGVNRTLKNTGTVNTIEPEVNGNGVKWIFDSYEASALAAGSVIQLFGQDLPAEARIVDWIIDHDALAGAALTLQFGTLADPNGFMAEANSFAADKKNFTDDGVAASLGFEIEAGDGQTLTITTSGSTATGTIKVAVAYVPKS